MIILGSESTYLHLPVGMRLTCRGIGYPSLHDALANSNVHNSHRLQNHTHTQKPISTLETAAQTPQYKTIAPGHTARAKADYTADHTAGMSLMDLAGRMVVHSESNSCAADVDRVRTRIRAIIRLAVRVFALSLELCSR